MADRRASPAPATISLRAAALMLHLSRFQWVAAAAAKRHATSSPRLRRRAAPVLQVHHSCQPSGAAIGAECSGRPTGRVARTLRDVAGRARSCQGPLGHCCQKSVQSHAAQRAGLLQMAALRLGVRLARRPPSVSAVVAMTAVRFLLNGKPWSEDGAPPTMTVLDWLRTRARLTGTKEGCAEGDCGACTVVLGRPVDGALQYQAVNSCLMMLPQIDNCAVLTVEGLAAPDGTLHPVQQAMIDTDATQCGFCTPGFVMAMFAFHHGGEPADSSIIHEALAGNLCRCTGYRSIVDACRRVGQGPADRFETEAPALAGALAARPPCTDYRHGAQTFLLPRSLDALFSAMAQLPDAILLAGGPDLGRRVSKDREALPAVIALAGVEELRSITSDAGAVALGGAVTYTEALPYLDRYFPSFAALVRRIGSRQIRNLGTIAGNLATASPIGDTIPCLIALDATVTLASRAGAR